MNVVILSQRFYERGYELISDCPVEFKVTLGHSWRLVVTSPNLQQVLSCAVSPGFQLCADKINSWIPELVAALNPS